MISDFIDGIKEMWNATSFMQGTIWQFLMILISCFLLYLAIVRKFEPLLLLPIAFGMLLANIPGSNMGSYDEGGLLNLFIPGY
jgi:Na+-transporting methylmalonyl-CoA/oxaloacetate decarboxylase beta subunit